MCREHSTIKIVLQTEVVHPSDTEERLLRVEPRPTRVPS